MNANESKYMPHIDGLRCIAVMAVLLFHFGVSGLGGGYVGVDIFFVISGYLITSIILGEITSTGRFDFGRFYARRVRRILPALIATLAVTTLVALVSLTPADLVAYGKSLAASAISLSNFLFWSESGYFDAASQTKPLLHTWSLSVEEQFYLVWPAFLFLCHRLAGRRGILWGVVGSGLISFLCNHLAVAGLGVGYQADLFFLPHFRVFEFALGALGCFLIGRLPASRRLHELMLAVGLVLIAYSIVTLREGDVFPYVNAVAPCVGTLLVIAARDSTGAAMLLGNRLTVWLGKISYSLYLVHWPIVVFVGQYMTLQGWPARFLTMAGMSLASAVVLHRLVEVRFRYGHKTGGGSLVRHTLVSAILCSCLGAVVSASNGMAWRYDYFTPGALGWSASSVSGQGGGDTTVAVAAGGAGLAAGGAQRTFRPMGAAEIDAGKKRRFEALASACTVETLDDPLRCAMGRPVQVLLFGNSHEPDAFNAFHEIYGGDKRVNLINFGTVNDCEVVLGEISIASSSRHLSCDKRFAVLDRDDFISTLDVIVFNAHQGFDYVARDLWRILEILRRRNPSLRIIALGSYLQTSSDCASLYNRFRSLDACRDPEFVNYFNIDERAKSPIPQVHTLEYVYISKYELFCGGTDLSRCAVQGNGEPAFYDQHHLSLGFARYMGQRLAVEHAAELASIGLPVPEKRQ